MNPNYCLMPSEIARLVYGYCLETGCLKSAQYLLEESPYLKEFAQGIKNGYPFSTKINNQSLLQILNGQWHGPMFGSSTNQNNAQSNFSTDHSGTNIFNSNNVSMPSTSSDQFSTPKHKILYSMKSGNNYSPRRKSATPKRYTNNASIYHQQHYNQQQLQRSNQLQQESPQSKQRGILSDHSCNNSLIFSSPLSSNESSEVEIEVQPETVFNELVKCAPLHAKLADSIQNIFYHDSNPNQSNSTIETKDAKIAENPDLRAANAKNAENNVVNKQDNIEKDLLPPSTIEEIISTLTVDPFFDDFLHKVVEKEIENTPFKNFPVTPGSCSSATSNNLNTPCIILSADDSKNYDPKTIPVKNIMKEMEEQEQQQQQQQKYQQQQNNSSNTIMNSEYLQEIKTMSPTNSNNIKESSKPKENLKISNSQQRVVDTNFTKIRPNHDVKIAKPKLAKFSKHQQEVHKAFNIAPLNNVNNVNNNDVNKAEPNKSLTTTIEIVPGDNSNKKEPDSQLGSNVENVISQQQINTTGIDVLTTPVNWPSNTITTQPIIIPNNQLAWDNNNGLVYLSYPSNDTIYYIDSQQIPSTAITTINSIGDDNFVNTTPITIASTSQNIHTQSNHQESVSNVATTTFSNVDDDVIAIESNVEQKQQQQSLKPSRPVPSILAKGKQKNSSKTWTDTLKMFPSNDNRAKNSSQVNNNSPQTKKSDDNHKFRRKLEPQLSRSENMKKRKMEHEELLKKRRNSLNTSDEKIKTILGSDLEKFLGDIHKDEKEK